MTSKHESKCPAVLQDRSCSRADQLQPASTSKPLTPFSIDDILSKPSVRRSCALSGAGLRSCPGEKVPSEARSLSGRAVLGNSSPLCALEELASKTFRGLEVSVLQAAEGKRLLLCPPLTELILLGAS